MWPPRTRWQTLEGVGVSTIVGRDGPGEPLFSYCDPDPVVILLGHCFLDWRSGKDFTERILLKCPSTGFFPCRT